MLEAIATLVCVFALGFYIGWLYGMSKRKRF